MKRRWALAISMVLLSQSVYANQVGQSIVVTQDRTEAMQILQEGVNEVFVNQPLEIQLEENSSTGYVWQVNFPEGIKVISDTFESGNTQLVGASGTHEWVIQVMSPGSYELIFSKQRPWEKEAIEAKTFVLNALEETKFTKDQIILSGQVLEVPGGIVEVKGQRLYPLKWLVEQMGGTVSWESKTRTATVENPTYQEAHLYLSYLNGIMNSKQDETYKLPERIKTLEIPPYPLKSGNSVVLHQKPIVIKIDDNGFNVPFAAYDYAFKNHQLYVAPEWFNTIFLAKLTKVSEGLEITYPTREQLEREITIIQNVLAPLTPEETLALWVRGQQVRSGALQYSSLSPELKQQVLANKQGWVTGGSSPSAGKVTILDKKQQGEDTWVYTLAVDEMLQGKVYEKIKQQITIKKYTLQGKDYWLISEAKGDLSYFSLLPDVPLA